MPFLCTTVRRARAAIILFGPAIAGAQQPARPAGRDSSARADSIARLAAVNIVVAPAERAEPVGATHVSAATVQRTPARDPYELLRLTAGVEVHEQGQGPGFASDASLRGFSSDHSTDLALWVDGVPINEPVNGHAEGYNDWALLFPGGIQDIDVVRGPTSALFGNFALAGIVNVRTLERMRGSDVTLSGGSFGRVEAMALTGFDHGADGGGVLGVRYQRENGFRPNAGYDITQGHGRLVHDLSPGITIDAGVELYGSNWNSAGFLGADEFASHQYRVVSNPSDGGYKRHAQERVSLRVLTGAFVWRSTVYATQGRWQLFLTIPPAGGVFEGSGSQTEEEDNRTGYGATSALTWAIPHGSVTMGAETRLDQSRYENDFTTSRMRDSTATRVDGRQLSAAMFFQAHADVTARLRVDAGLRYDALTTRSAPDGDNIVSATHAILSPKIGALLRVARDMGVYGNVSRGFRSANGVISDPTLTPITAWAYERGLKFDHGNASASAALFRMDVSNEQTVNPVTLVGTNGGSSRRQGVEIDWHLPVASGIAVSGDWTFNDARYTSIVAAPQDGGRLVDLSGLRVYNTAKYIGAATLDVSLPADGWQLRLGGNWVGPYSPFDKPGIVVGAYGLANLSMTVPIRMSSAVSLVVGVRNVLDRAYPELIAGDVVSPGQPRTVYVTARARL